MNRVLSYSAAYMIYVTLLHQMEGPWKSWDKGDVIDAWTITHIVWGALGKKWGLSPSEMTVLAALNEVGEALVRKYRKDLLFGSPETVANIVTDIVVTVAAYAITPD